MTTAGWIVFGWVGCMWLSYLLVRLFVAVIEPCVFTRRDRAQVLFGGALLGPLWLVATIAMILNALIKNLWPSKEWWDQPAKW